MQKIHVDLALSRVRYRIFCDVQRRPFSAIAKATGTPVWMWASRTLADIRIDIERGIFRPESYSERPTHGLILKHYSERFLADRAPDLAPSSLRWYRSHLGTHVLPQLGDLDIREIRMQHGRQLRRAVLAKGRSDKTAHDAVRALWTLLRQAHQDGDLPSVPALPDLPIEEPAYHTYEYEQQLAVLAKMPEEHRRICDLLIHDPIRPSEARALQLHDLHLGDRLVQIRRTWSDREIRSGRKKGRGYWIAISERSAESLRYIVEHYEDLYGVAPMPAGFVFLMPASSRSRGKPYSKRLPDWWRQAALALGLEDIGLYCATRHSWGRQALEAGMTLEEVRQAMGHTHAEMTRRYAKPGPRALRASIHKLETARVTQMSSRPNEVAGSPNPSASA